jgi:L-2-hydroxyglutarate oxidase LhgO
VNFTFDVVVIGAGVVGLACAKHLVDQGCSTLVVESEASFATGTSSRNSQVILAGIYYEHNSHKAQLCVHGKHLLYEYCLSRGIPHKKLVSGSLRKTKPKLKNFTNCNMPVKAMGWMTCSFFRIRPYPLVSQS